MAEKKNLTDVFKERKGKAETDAQSGTSAVEKLTQSGAAAITTRKAETGNCGCLLTRKNK